MRRRLNELKLLEKNARYMEKHEFDQLVDNVKRDGCLMSLPIIYQDIIYSGNHRTQAAIAAGIDEADCLEILTPLSEEQLLAIQLSHNAIAGKDDPNILAQLFLSIQSLEFKAYTGLEDGAFKCDDETLKSMGIRRPAYEELTLMFLPEEASAFLSLVDRVEKAKRQPTTLVGRFEDFEKLFDALVLVKQKRNIINNAAALHEMARITLDVLAREEAAAKAAAAQPTPAPATA